MANTIKPKRMKKKTFGFAIKIGLRQDLQEYCEANNLVPSNVVEELIMNYLKEKERG